MRTYKDKRQRGKTMDNKKYLTREEVVEHFRMLQEKLEKEAKDSLENDPDSNYDCDCSFGPLNPGFPPRDSHPYLVIEIDKNKKTNINIMSVDKHEQKDYNDTSYYFHARFNLCAEELINEHILKNEGIIKKEKNG